MVKSHSKLAAISALFGALAVAAGAFGAHALKSSLSSYQMEIWQTAVFYHLIHALLAFFVAKQNTIENANQISLVLLTGVTLFSGSLYLMALTSYTKIGFITPLGGILFIGAWFYIALSEWKQK